MLQEMVLRNKFTKINFKLLLNKMKVEVLVEILDGHLMIMDRNLFMEKLLIFLSNLKSLVLIFHFNLVLLLIKEQMMNLGVFLVSKFTVLTIKVFLELQQILSAKYSNKDNIYQDGF